MEKFNYQGNDYIYDNGRFYQQNGTGQTIPNFMAKHYAVNSKSIDALCNSYIFATHPSKFNDPFDNYRYLFDATDITNDHNKIKSLFEGVISEHDIKQCISNNQIFLDCLDHIMFSHIGIISLTGSNNLSPVMWSHYTNNKGFGVVFNSEILLDNNKMSIIPAIYVEKLEKIKLQADKAIAQFLCKALIKHIDWKVEDEWRILAILQKAGNDTDSRKIAYDPRAIKEIRLAHSFFDVSMMTKNNDEYTFSMNENEKLLTKFFEHVQNNEIPLSLLCFDNDGFRYTPQPIRYIYNSQTSSVKFSFVNKKNPIF